MKSLKYILEKSVLNDIENSIQSNEDILYVTIENWINENCKIGYSTPGKVSIDKKGKKYIINSNDAITITNKELEEIPDFITFGKVLSFSCSDCTKLKSLNGCPQSVKNFSCSGCTSLTSLEGCPQKLKGSFSCRGCTSLTSLKGGPKIMGSTTSNKKSPFHAKYDANECTSLKTIEGLPEYANDIFLEGNYQFSLRELKDSPFLPKEFRTIHLGFGCIDGSLSTYWKR